jgi:hypothetical protein
MSVVFIYLRREELSMDTRNRPHKDLARGIDRRHFLAVTSSAIIGLFGCSSGNDSSNGSGTSPQPTGSRLVLAPPLDQVGTGRIYSTNSLGGSGDSTAVYLYMSDYEANGTIIVYFTQSVGMYQMACSMPGVGVADATLYNDFRLLAARDRSSGMELIFGYNDDGSVTQQLIDAQGNVLAQSSLHSVNGSYQAVQSRASGSIVPLQRIANGRAKTTRDYTARLLESDNNNYSSDTSSSGSLTAAGVIADFRRQIDVIKQQNIAVINYFENLPDAGKVGAVVFLGALGFTGATVAGAAAAAAAVTIGVTGFLTVARTLNNTVDDANETVYSTFPPYTYKLP